VGNQLHDSYRSNTVGFCRREVGRDRGNVDVHTRRNGHLSVPQYVECPPVPARFKPANAPSLWDLFLSVRGEKILISLGVPGTEVRRLV